MTKQASLIAVCSKEESIEYLVQARNVNIPKFSSGEYSFIFPGAFSLFGGELEEGEDAKQGFERELQEELPGLEFESYLEHRQYDWSGKDLDNVLLRAEKIFNGNVMSFLGFDLNARVPPCSLGKERGKDFSYREYISRVVEDNFYVGRVDEKYSRNLDVREGDRAIWLPHQVIRSLVMCPTDKLAILDDLCDRVESGEIVLK